jgi:hypothetical protein
VTVPGYVLHMSATVVCAHGGQAQPTVTLPRVKLGGRAAVGQAAPYTVAGCSLVPPAPGPCVTAQWTTAATRVTSGGIPVLLQDSMSTCVPTGTPLQVVVVQTRVKGT